MATSGSATAASRATGTEAPPTNARERPSAATLRARTTRSSSTSPPDSTTAWATAGSASTRSTPSTRAERAPARTAPVSARPPSRSPSAVTTMVLPAPVSPVTTVRPGPSSRVEDSMTPSEPIRISSSIVSLGQSTTPLAGAPPALDGQAELGHQAVGEGCLVQPDQPDRAVPTAYLDPGPGWQVDGPAAVAPQH